MVLNQIINSLLETDMYKFSMGQAIYHQFSDYKTTWTFKCQPPMKPKQQDFDHFAHPSQTASSAEEYRRDTADGHTTDMSVTITKGHPAEEFVQPAGDSQKSTSEDPFFAMIKKIKD